METEFLLDPTKQTQMPIFSGNSTFSSLYMEMVFVKNNKTIGLSCELQNVLPRSSLITIKKHL